MIHCENAAPFRGGRSVTEAAEGEDGLQMDPGSGALQATCLPGAAASDSETMATMHHEMDQMLKLVAKEALPSKLSSLLATRSSAMACVDAR